MTATLPQATAAELTEPERPFVVALDVLTSGISVARFEAGATKPKLRWIPGQPDTATSHSVASTLTRHHAVAAQVLDAVTTVRGQRVRPTMVAMVKLSYGLMNRDPSAVRRIGLWFQVADVLAAERIPLAEIPALSAEKWLRGDAHRGRNGYAAAADAVTALYPDLVLPDERFRLTTVAVAGAAAMAVGIETAVAISQERLDALRGFPVADGKRVSLAIQWPAARKPPKTLAEWGELNGAGEA